MEGSCHHPSLEIAAISKEAAPKNIFLGAGDGVTHPKKITLRVGDAITRL
jgi:hypothetical protein